MIIQVRNNQEGNNIETNQNLVTQLKNMGFAEYRARNQFNIDIDILLGEEGQN